MGEAPLNVVSRSTHSKFWPAVKKLAFPQIRNNQIAIFFAKMIVQRSIRYKKIKRQRPMSSLLPADKLGQVAFIRVIWKTIKRHHKSTCYRSRIKLIRKSIYPNYHRLVHLFLESQHLSITISSHQRLNKEESILNQMLTKGYVHLPSV